MKFFKTLTDEERETLERNIRDWLETRSLKWVRPKHELGDDVVELVSRDDQGVSRMCQACINRKGATIYTAAVDGCVRLSLGAGKSVNCAGNHDAVIAATPAAAMKDAEALFWADVQERLDAQGHNGAKLVRQAGGRAKAKPKTKRKSQGEPSATQAEMFGGAI